MALRPEEILRIKFELGVSVTLIGAEPYIAYLAVFDKAIQPYIIDPTTTSSTVVGAVVGGAAVSITVGAIPVIAGSSTPAFTAGTTVSVDVGPNNETAQIQVISGTTLWLTLANSHGQNGAYPVAMAGGEQVVRDILTRLDTIKNFLNTLAPAGAGMKRVDEIEQYAASKSSGRGSTLDTFRSLLEQREQARTDLGEAIGFPNLRNGRKSGGMSSVPY